MKKIIFMMFILVFVFALNVAAQEVTTENIGVVLNNNTNCIQLINPTTQEISEPLLKGELGSYGGGLYDVDITPDGKTAILSNFGDSSLIFVDISGGFSATPTLLGAVSVGFFAEDIAITPDGKYALVTDGGFSPIIAVVDIATRTLVRTRTLPDECQAVSISPDGQTVVTVGYFSQTVSSYAFSEGAFSLTKTEFVAPLRPVNVAISPDGKTAMAVGSNGYYFAAFYIDKGVLYYVGPVKGLAKGAQTCVFSKDGTKAYILNNFGINPGLGKGRLSRLEENGTKVQVLDVTGPGQITPSDVIHLSIPRGSSQLFGVDTMAIDPSGQYLYVTNPTVSDGVVEITVIDLTTNTEVNQIKANGIPTGIAFGTMDHPPVLD
ncbi:MAG: hypothetical protein ACM3SY_02590 [Candidatus Omnitrophota bacterium]